MLAKNRRIQKALFSKVFSGGKRFVSAHFLVGATKIGGGTSRFAFSVSKKVCKRAVDRNRLRRQGYAVIEKHLKNIPPGFIFIFTFKKFAEKISFSEMEKEICDMIANATK
jgi:ribonuclease P protein component